MIQIAIVEDQAQERARLKSFLREMETQEKLQFVITEFATGEAFLLHQETAFDIVLMDIEMPGMDGLETARAMREMDPAVILIFITNLAQYAVNGYEVDALDFIIKPVNQHSFAMKLQRAISRTEKRSDDLIAVRKDRETSYVRVSAIRYLEVSGHYVIYHTTVGDVMEYTTLKEVERRLNRPFFVRCNQCYLVNLRYVTAVRKNSVLLDADELTISRPQRKNFLLALSEFLGGTTQ